VNPELTAFRKLPFWLALATLAGLAYLATARFGAGHIGFPLDDAWIHQTYARNLALRGEFAFTPGRPSTGSTAPLWTLLLAAGYVLRLPYKVWAYALGILFLGLSGFWMARLGARLFPHRPRLGVAVGLAVVLEWHLVWAAVSGMETMLFVWLSILLVERYAAVASASPEREGWAFGGLGLLGGLLALVRPEGVGLAALIGADVLWAALEKRPARGRTFLRLAALGAGVLLPILPYLAFNLHVTGLLLPNTFYAKQREYAILLSRLSLAERWLRVVGVTLIGGQVLLLPGLLRALFDARKRANRLLALAAVWWLGYLTLYAFRLPVTYQHGRYQIPTLPWLLLLGVWGTANLLPARPHSMGRRVLSRAWGISIAAGMVLFVALGARGYANDVTFIETEMVKTARWLNEHTPPDATIAAHDIGAIGYFTSRPLVDLAGLVTPAVIPIIRDEDALLRFAIEAGAEYLVTFPSWYPAISRQLPQVYSTNSLWAIQAGYDNMKVYRLPAQGNPNSSSE